MKCEDCGRLNAKWERDDRRRCNGCRSEFPFRNLTVDHIIPESRGGTEHIENLQLLCGHCNSVKDDRPQEYLVARLRELGIAA